MSGLDAYEKRADSRGREGSPTRARRLGPLFALVLASGAGAAEPEAVPPEAPAATVYATATVRERPVESATAAVTVVDREAIEALGAVTVADVLAFIPGVTLETAGTRGGLTTARIRGGDPNFTLVLLDGVPLNDGTYPVGDVFDLEALPAAAVERIEVVRGPLSAFYGSTGLAGAVHVITRSGGPGGLRGEVEAAAGDAGLRRLEAGLSGGGTGNAAYFLGFTHDQEEGRIARESFSLDHLQGRLDLRLGEGAGLRLAGRAAAWAADDYPEASGGPVLGSGELRRGDHGEASLGAELVVRRPGERLYKLTAALYRHETDRESPAVAPLVPPSAEATRFTRGRLGGALSLAPAPGWTVSFGADLEHERGENESTLLLPPEAGGALPGDYLLSRTSAGVYTEVIAELTESSPLVVELGLRADFPEGGSEQASPRLGMSWRPGDGRTRFRASAGRAFKLPSFFALASPPALGGNPELEPETMVGGDLGVERE
ncbi:MAG TPA: TonB-dependent receptor, partial [Thermoanaerobaculia bacterium]|nr:TonB-dependent receptor [Thermoanaerobaculia bacterium]